MALSSFSGSGFKRTIIISLVIVFGTVGYCYAVGGHGGDGTTVDEIKIVLLGLVVVLIASKLGGELFVRLGQPAVLGEIITGMIIGNLYLFGTETFQFFRYDEPIKILSEIGVTLLLFQVGLESDLSKMMKVGASSLVVATLGIVAPFFLGWGVAAYFLPDSSIYVHLFIGATLCATSVGITARVLMDLGKLKTTESRIILGAAVVDDVQGLVILAVITGIIQSANSGAASVDITSILIIIAKAVGFLFGAILIGKLLTPKLFRIAFRMRGTDLLLSTSLGICFLFAYIAHLVGLATIVGAFAAGLILEEVHWRKFHERGEHTVEELIHPIAGFLVPVFFVRMGANVDIASFARVEVLGFAAALTLVAIIGKQVCSLGVIQKGIDKLTVGIGMVPRGEVGLIFAAIGKDLILDGHPVIDTGTFSAVVIMVLVTTMVTPPALKWSLTRMTRKQPASEVQLPD